METLMSIGATLVIIFGAVVVWFLVALFSKK